MDYADHRIKGLSTERFSCHQAGINCSNLPFATVVDSSIASFEQILEASSSSATGERVSTRRNLGQQFHASDHIGSTIEGFTTTALSSHSSCQT